MSVSQRTTISFSLSTRVTTNLTFMQKKHGRYRTESGTSYLCQPIKAFAVFISASILPAYTFGNFMLLHAGNICKWSIHWKKTHFLHFSSFFWLGKREELKILSSVWGRNIIYAGLSWGIKMSLGYHIPKQNLLHLFCIYYESFKSHLT